MILDNIKSAFGNLIEDNDSDFADVTLACEDGHQLEAHKVILDGSRPPNNHLRPLVLAKGFHLSSKIFLLGGKQRWGEDTSDLILMRNRGQNLGYQKEKIIF